MTSQQPTVLIEVNQGTIVITKNPVAHTQAKCADTDYHYIHEAVLPTCTTVQLSQRLQIY